jgi:hypothetical protein
MIAMSFMRTAYCNRNVCGRGRRAIATICHDLPAPRPDPHPEHAGFEAPNQLKVRRLQGVTLMSAHAEVRSWVPQLLNWLAVVVLLSLGLLV